MGKTNYGLSMIHYAKVTETDGVLSFGTPKALPGAIKVTRTPRGTNEQFEADDIIYKRTSSNEGYTLSLDLYDDPKAFYVDALGQKVDSKGALIENAYDEIPKIAFLMQADGEENDKKRLVYYYCQATRPTMESATGLKKTPMQRTLVFEADPRPDTKDVRAVMERADDASAFDAWFEAVYEPEQAEVDTEPGETEPGE